MPPPSDQRRARMQVAGQGQGVDAVILRLHRVARRADRVSLGDMVDALGPSSMAAVLLVPALLLVSPLSGIPGASIIGGVVIALIAAQIVLRREKVWLPRFLRDRTLPAPALRRALVGLRKPARRFDGVAPSRPGGAEAAWWRPVVALFCLALGLAMPMLELIPFSSTVLASLVTLLALAMLTGRARLALLVLGLVGAVAGGAVWAL